MTQHGEERIGHEVPRQDAAGVQVASRTGDDQVRRAMEASFNARTTEEDLIAEAIRESQKPQYSDPTEYHPQDASETEAEILARALRESEFSGATTMHAREEEMMAQALRASQLEEEVRLRRSLRAEQDAELQESIIMDRQREAEAQQAAHMEAQGVAKQTQQTLRVADTAQERQRRVVEQAQARLPAEPATGELRVDVLIRLRDGRRLIRSFCPTDTVVSLYDLVDGESVSQGCGYRLVSSMPRKVYDDQTATLAQVGLAGQCALLIEPVGIAQR